MKLFTPALALLPLLFAACTPKSENKTESEPISLDGVWEMTHLYDYDENGDSTEIDRMGHRQVKIYADNYVMWARTVPEDAAQWYGWGGYAVEDGFLKEWIEYGSHAFMPRIDPMDPFEHRLSVSDNRYIQTRYDSLGKPQMSEHYILISQEPEIDEDEDVEDNYPSLEGVWEMTQLERNGEIIDRTGYRQIKMYYHGHVMWSQMVPKDSVEWFGYGKYSSDGGILTEWMEFGSKSFMPFIGEEPFIMNLIYGEDTYQQIQQDDEGTEVNREYYKRIEGDTR